MDDILVLGIWFWGRRPTLSLLSRKQLAFRYLFHRARRVLGRLDHSQSPCTTPAAAIRDSRQS